MKHLYTTLAVILSVTAWAFSSLARTPIKPQSNRIRQDSLVTGFRTPPDWAKPLVLWQWMNGNVTKEGITSDLESFKRVGLGGTQQFLIGGDQMELTDPTVEVLNPKWRELMKFAMDESARLNLSFGTHNSPGWSSSGGPQVKVEQSMQKIVWTTQEFKGPGTFNGTLAQAVVDPKWNYYRDIAVFAVASKQTAALSNQTAVSRRPITRQEVIELTNQMDKTGKLSWSAPEGDWTIIRFGHTSTGSINHTAPESGQGLEVDKMSRSALDAFWAGFPSEVVKIAGKNAGKSLRRFEIDSYEAGAQDWTPRMREEFQKRRGYDPLPWFPALANFTIDNQEMTERFREDWRQTIAELFAENYFGYMRELTHRVPGMELMVEPYGTGAGAVFDYGAVAGTADILMCEFWQKPASWGWDSIKPVSSNAHVWGQSIVAAEAFTGQPQYAWVSDPYALKSTGDRAFSGGVNQMVLHASAHQAWRNAKPGITMGWWGTHFGPGQTWWEHGGPQWLAYLTRCQFLLQQGLFVGDIAYLGRGRISPKPPVGYEGDGLAESAFLTRMSVKDGRLMLPDGMSYRVLVLPDSPTMTPQVVRKLRELVQDGATIIGRKPTRAPGMENYPASEAEVVRIADELWGDADGKTIQEHTFGKGKVIWGKSPEAVLSQINVEPDVQTDRDWLWTHRRIGNTEVYFISNQKDESVAANVSFRVQGLQPELWHADTGKTEPMAVWSSQNGRTVVPLRLDPSGSVFVVFRQPVTNVDSIVAVKKNGLELLTIPSAQTNVESIKAGDEDMNLHRSENGGFILEVRQPGSYVAQTAAGKQLTAEVKDIPAPLTITGAWSLRFPFGWGAPSEVTLDRLIPWNEYPERGVKYFSGTATYGKAINLPPAQFSPNRRFVLDLGQVKNIAEVRINGREAGILWKPPFRIDVSDVVKPGKNLLEVRVTNLWVNRLVGDEQEPDDAKWGDVKIFTYVTPPVEIGRPLMEVPEWFRQGTPRPSSGRYTFTSFKFFNKDSALIESGLIGPVQMEMVELKPMK